MEKLKEVLETIFKVIFEVIDFAFAILEAPYVLIMSYFLYYEKCEFIYG